MRKLELIEAINDRLPIKKHPEIISIYLGRAFNQIVYETFSKDFSNLDLYTRVYDVDVKYDEERDVYYSELPVSVIQLPIPGDGVISIQTKKGKSIEFAAKKAGMLPIHYRLEVSSLDGPIPYYIMNGRIEYETRYGLSEVKQVTLRLIPQFEQYDMMDEIHIPSGKDERMLELTVNFLLGAPGDKEINDQTQKTP